MEMSYRYQTIMITLLYRNYALWEGEMISIAIVWVCYCFTEYKYQMQVLNWFLEDKKQQIQVYKFIPKIIIGSKSNLYVEVQPRDPTTTSNIVITAFVSQQIRSIIPIKVQWSRFKVRSESIHATQKIHCLTGNTYMCEPGDVGGYIKAIVRSVDESIRGEAEVIVGPIAIDVMVKRVIQGALYAGSLLSQVVLCERERKSNVTIRLGARTIEVVDEASQEKLVRDYSISQPKIELNPKDPTRVYFRFEQDQQGMVRQWLNKVFGQQGPNLQESSLSIRVPYSSHSSSSSKMRLFQKSHGPCPNKFQLRFISRHSRDLFLFTQRAFVCREDMKNSLYIQRVQTLLNISTEQDYHRFLQFMALKMQITRISQYAHEVEQDRDAKVKDLAAMEESIGEMTLTYLKIIEEKGRHEKIDFEQSYSQINQTREDFLNRKHVRELKAQNQGLKQRLRELNQELQLQKFFRKQENQSMIFNQTTNPFAKKMNDSIAYGAQSPQQNKSHLRNMHQLSINYANLLQQNRQLKSENRQLKGDGRMTKLDRSQNMIQLLGSLDEREQRQAKQAKFMQYQQALNSLRRENDDLKRKLNQSVKSKGLTITKFKSNSQQPSFINNHSIINQSINNQSHMSNSSTSFLNNSITSQAAILKLQQNLQNLSKINNKLQEDNTRLRRERDYYRNQFTKMKQFLKEFQSQGKMSVSGIMEGEVVGKLREDVERLENQKKSMQRRIESMSKENSGSLKEQFLAREKKIKELQDNIKRLQQSKSSHVQKQKDSNWQIIQGQNSKLKRINTQLLQQIKNLKLQLQLVRDDKMYNSRVIQLQNELAFSNKGATAGQDKKLLEQINELSKQVARLKQEGEQKSLKLHTQTQTIEKLMMQHDKNQRTPETMRNSSITANSKQKCYSQRTNQPTVQQLQKYKREIKKLQQQVIFLKRSADAMNRSRDLTLQMDSFNEDKIQQLKKDIQFLQFQNQNISKMCEKYLKQARQANKQKEIFRKKMIELTSSKHEDSSLLLND